MASGRVVVVVVLAAASFLLFLGASSATPRPPPPAVYDVGGAMGWAVPLPGNATLNRWAMSHRFHVRDVLNFKCSGNDSVLLVRRGDYDRCATARPVGRWFTGGGGGGTRFTLRRLGLFYFIGGAPGRCDAGQRMVVRVVDARARSSSLGGGGAPAPAPAPAPMATEEPTDSPNNQEVRPVPAMYKLFVAAVLGFVGGCLFTVFILWLCVKIWH